MPSRTIPIRHFKTIDSTNLEAARLFAGGEARPLWLIADEQVQGRGRLGRNWLSPTGNLYATLLFDTSAPVGAIGQLGFVVALAVHDTVAAVTPSSSVTLKWPNDCLLNGAKVAGILCEKLGDNPCTIAIGCGINIAHGPQGLAYPTGFLHQFNAEASVERVFDSYRQALEKWLAIWKEGSGFPAIIPQWQARAAGLGEYISVRDHGKILSGWFHGLAADGAMRLGLPDGSERLVYAGDVSLNASEEMPS